MELEQYYLIKLAEEASKISQIALKTARFGLANFHPGSKKTNRELIHQELTDLLAVVSALNNFHDLGYVVDTDLMEVRLNKIQKYLGVSIELGKANP
jgi:hypothetical protein